MEVYVLVAGIEYFGGFQIVGIYETEDAARKHFSQVLDCIWPDRRVNMGRDDNGNNKKECIEDLLYCNNRFRDYLVVQRHTIQKS